MFKQLTATLFAALLMLGFSALSLDAADMKCGAGKCGASMSKEMQAKGCAGCNDCPDPDCAAKKDPSKPCDCQHDQKGGMKCGTGKCGKAAPVKSVKCGSN